MTNEEIIKTAQPLEHYHSDLNEIIRRLDQEKQKGENVYVVFQGKKLYSLIDNEESCYLKATGETKVEFERKQREEWVSYRKSKLEKQLEFLDKFEDRIEKGKSVLPSTKHAAWTRTMWELSDDQTVSIEDPCDVMIEFFEAWMKGAPVDKLDKILTKLEIPEAFFKYIKQTMGPIVDNYLAEFSERAYGPSTSI